MKGQFAALIRLARSKSGLTQKQVAVLVGTSPKEVSNMENGRANVSVVRLNAIMEALGFELLVDIRAKS